MICVFGLAAATMLTFVAPLWWLADLCANLRMQGVIGVVGTGVLLSCFRKWKLVALQLCLVCLHLPWFVDTSLKFSPSETAGSRGLRLTAANVYTGNLRHDDIQAELLQSNTDLVAVLELSTALTKSLSTEFSKQYPYAIEDPQDAGNFGVGLYSRIPLESPGIIHFSSGDIPSVAATLTFNDHKVHLLATHTLPPIGRYGFSHRNKHLQMIGSYIKEYRVKHPGVPVVVMGDLNLTPWSPVFDELLQRSQLQRAVTGNRVIPTWYRYPAFPFGLVLDHVLISDELRCVAHRVGADVGSDHRFVTAELAID